MSLLIALALLIALIGLYAAVATGSRKAAEYVSVALIATVLVAFCLWFVFYGPTPDYLPPYGSDPCDIPNQMKD